MQGRVIAQLDHTARGSIVREAVWTGGFSTRADQPSPNLACLDWTTSIVTESGGAGESELSASRFFSSVGNSCNSPRHHLYCLQE